jgi:hypothetical protein
MPFEKIGETPVEKLESAKIKQEYYNKKRL